MLSWCSAYRIVAKAVVAFVALVHSVEAEQMLRFSDGEGFVVEGELLNFDGEFLELETEAGTLTLMATALECTGSGCPEPPNFEVDFSAPDSASRRLLASLLRAYARSDGLAVAETHSIYGLDKIELLDNRNGSRIAINLGTTGGDWRLQRGAGAGVLVAFDALAPVVAPENPVTGLTLLSLQAAIAGEFPSWFGLGGDDVPVSIHWADELSGPTARRFGFRPAQGLTQHDGFQDAAFALIEDAGGLSVLPYGDIGTAVPLVVTGACGRGTLGVPDAIRTGDYPLSDILVLQPPSTRPPLVLRKFVRWLSGDEAATAITNSGFVSLEVRPVRGAMDGRQEADAVALAFTGGVQRDTAGPILAGATRINVAMRFQDGSSLPDRRAQLQIARLSQAIKEGVFDGKKLVFVGFSDADGAASANLRLSERRADAIRSEVTSRVGFGGRNVEFEAMGLGEAMPVACNGVDWGERLNRRVEVWMFEP